jgi:magnesium chelatase family protein
LKIYSEKNNISARSIHRILKVSRTIADLKWNKNISFEDLTESLQFRVKIGQI